MTDYFTALLQRYIAARHAVTLQPYVLYGDRPRQPQALAFAADPHDTGQAEPALGGADARVLQKVSPPTGQALQSGHLTHGDPASPCVGIGQEDSNAAGTDDVISRATSRAVPHIGVETGSAGQIGPARSEVAAPITPGSQSGAAPEPSLGLAGPGPLSRLGECDRLQENIAADSGTATPPVVERGGDAARTPGARQAVIPRPSSIAAGTGAQQPQTRADLAAPDPASRDRPGSPQELRVAIPPSFEPARFEPAGHRHPRDSRAGDETQKAGVLAPPGPAMRPESGKAPSPHIQQAFAERDNSPDSLADIEPDCVGVSQHDAKPYPPSLRVNDGPPAAPMSANPAPPFLHQATLRTNITGLPPAIRADPAQHGIATASPAHARSATDMPTPHMAARRAPSAAPMQADTGRTASLAGRPMERGPGAVSEPDRRAGSATASRTISPSVPAPAVPEQAQPETLPLGETEVAAEPARLDDVAARPEGWLPPLPGAPRPANRQKPAAAGPGPALAPPATGGQASQDAPASRAALRTSPGPDMSSPVDDRASPVAARSQWKLEAPARPTPPAGPIAAGTGATRVLPILPLLAKHTLPDRTPTGGRRGQLPALPPRDEAADTVVVCIERLDIVAAPPTQPERRPSLARRVGLDEFLARRRRGGQQ